MSPNAQPTRNRVSATSRTAVYGPVRTVVWEGRSREAPPYPDQCPLCRYRHKILWTGHKPRLDRDLKNRFGSRNYAAEELIPELGAAFLCAEFGFDGDVRNARYISNWIELLKADKRAFFTACSQASKAAVYLRGLALAAPAERAARLCR